VGGDAPRVLLRAEFAGSERTWEGRVVRTEGEIDPQTRMVHVVARVDDPYDRAGRREGPPLAVGLFVEARILGRSAPNAFVLPRQALRDGDQVLLVDDDNRLRFRKVTVLRSEEDRVVIGEGLAAGDRVCVSPIPAPVEGMVVRVTEEAAGALPASAPAADGPEPDLARAAP
jgi:multidrug efflux system membrane fusion protein